MKNKLLVFLLGLLGFSISCEPQTDAYGSPHVLFHVSGKVSDTKGNPIKGITITSWYTKAQTDEQGNYVYSDRDAMPGEEVTITFTDPDGPDNGGDFEEQTVGLNITEADRIGDGDGDWCKGEYAKTMDVTLKSKDE